MAKSKYFAVNQFPVFVHKACIWLLLRVISRSDPWHVEPGIARISKNRLFFHVSYL